MAADKKEKQTRNQPPNMPFDEALRVLLKSPPQHKETKKKGKKK